MVKTHTPEQSIVSCEAQWTQPWSRVQSQVDAIHTSVFDTSKTLVYEVSQTKYICYQKTTGCTISKAFFGYIEYRIQQKLKVVWNGKMTSPEIIAAYG